MRSSTALLLAVALSASAIPLPKKEARHAKLALREPDVVHVWKHRHFDSATDAPQRRDQKTGHPNRHDGHGDGHWTQGGTWVHARTGSLSNSGKRSPHSGEEEEGPHRHGRGRGRGRHGPPGGCGDQKPDGAPGPGGPPNGPPNGPPPDAPPPDQQSPPPQDQQPPPQDQQPPPQDQQPPPQDQQPPPQDQQPPPQDQQPPPQQSGNPNAQAYLDPHNAARARWNAQPVVWDDNLAQLAQKWVDGCTFEHSGGSLTSDFGYGENLAAGTGEQSIPDAVSGWVNEESKWDRNNPGFSMDTGHFTQLVWKSTTTIGCAYADCPSSKGPFGDGYGPTWRLHSCMYTPPGNFGGEYENNVG